MKRKAFALTELIVTVTIIGLLTTLSFKKSTSFFDGDIKNIKIAVFKEEVKSVSEAVLNHLSITQNMPTQEEFENAICGEDKERCNGTVKTKYSYVSYTQRGGMNYIIKGYRSNNSEECFYKFDSEIGLIKCADNV